MALRFKIDMAKKRQIWNPEWDKKRQIIKASLNENEQAQMITKYGVVLSSKMLKEIIFNESITVHTVIVDKTKEEHIFQLKKIGNNLNQIAWKLNANYDVDPKGIKILIEEVKKAIKSINEN